MGLFSKKEILQSEPGVLYAITSGRVIKIEQVKDEVFAQKMMGDGLAFVSEDGEVVSPCDGIITAIFQTNHAIGITTDDGTEILIHIGIDTVKEGGNGFKGFVKNGERVTRGQKLIIFDKQKLEAKGYDLTIPMIITNMDEITIKIIADGAITKGTKVMQFKKITQEV